MRILLIVKNNIKKKKSNAVVLFLLVSMAVLLLYVGTSVLTNLGTVIDNRNSSVNGADYLLVTQSSFTDDIMGAITARPETVSTEREDAVLLYGAKYYKDTERSEDSEQLVFFFCDLNSERTMSVATYVNQDTWQKDSIVLPYYMKVGLGYKEGEIIHIKAGDEILSFTINSFLEDVMFSTPTNISAEKCFISSERFDELYGNTGRTMTLFRAGLSAGSDSDVFENSMTKQLNTSIPDFMYYENWTLNYQTMRQGTSISATIFMGVLTVFAFILILVALVIVHFNVNNAIEGDMKNIGILEASGYTGRQLRFATVLEFLIISLIGSIFGLIVAIAAVVPIGGIISSSVGLRWELAFDIFSAAISVVAALLLVLVAVYRASARYKRITPLDALRDGISSHNFKKNHIKLHKTHLSLNLAVAMKNVLFYKKKSLIICAIVALLTFSATEAISIYVNLAMKPDTMIAIAGFEIPDVMVNAKNAEPDVLKANTDAAYDIIRNCSNTDNINRYVSHSVYCRNGERSQSTACDVYSDTSILRTDTVIEGRRPKYANEVMMTTIIADSLDVEVGDTIYIDLADKSADFIVSGISQGITNLGKKIMITEDGLHRLDSERVVSNLYCYAIEGTDLKSYIANLERQFSGYDVEIVNYQDYIEASMRSVISILKALCLVMLAVAGIVIALVLVLLIKAQMVRDMKQLGINKALGFTTGQLVRQTVLGYLPVVLLGCVIGSIVSYFLVNPTFLLCLSAMGIQKCNIDVSLSMLLGITALISAWSLLIATLCSARIRKIMPCRMLQEL